MQSPIQLARPHSFRIAIVLGSALIVVLGAGTASPDERVKPRWKYDPKFLRPVWQGDTVEGESVLFIRDPKTGAAKASVLFPVRKILSVRNSAGNVTYKEGRDYRWKPGTREITLTVNSRIVSRTPAELRRPAGSQKYNLTHRDGKGEIFFGSKLEYHNMQTCITYSHAQEDWKSRTPTFNDQSLPRTIQKLRDRKSVSIVLIGDSISAGCNASGWADKAPFQPSFPGLLQQHLTARYQAKVRVTNPSVSGKDTRWVLSAIDKVVAPRPDLVIVAFGMNDAAGRSAKEYQTNTKTVMAKIREKLPDVEFILVASMLGNRNWIRLKHELFPQYRDALERLCKPGIALADMTSLWTEFFKRKRNWDLTGNGVNHPNDFGHRVYAQVLSTLLVPPRPKGWQPHTVRQLAGKAGTVRLAARFQIVSESWNRVVAVPYLVNMPEKDRLLMLVGCDYPHRAFILTSDDRGATWTQPRPARVGDNGKASIGLGTSLAYLGKGKLIFYETGNVGAGHPARWFSTDYGRTWGNPVAIAASTNGKRWSIWDPPLVDRHPKTGKIKQLAETGYAQSGTSSQAYIRFSTNEGRTWGKSIHVPQWRGVNEAYLFRAGNRNLLAACRTDVPRRLKGKTLDHYEGMGISISKDDGRTWSAVKKLYDYGRHHPSLVLMPNQDIVMTYVVRLGYVNDRNGFPQFGIEAVVSHDHGATWDLDHRYLLHVWSGKRKGKTYWWPSSQATSSTLMRDGTILTAFGTGYRIKAGKKSPQAPRDAGLIEWRLNTKAVNTDSAIRDAAFDSDLRNVFDPKE